MRAGELSGASSLEPGADKLRLAGQSVHGKHRVVRGEDVRHLYHIIRHELLRRGRRAGSGALRARHGGEVGMVSIGRCLKWAPALTWRQKTSTAWVESAPRTGAR